MKINFNASYSTLSTWLESSQNLISRKESDIDFSKKLAELLPKHTQPIENTKEIGGLDTKDITQPKAMLNFSKLNFKTPELEFEKIVTPQITEPIVKPSVKTPTLVSVKRLFSSDVINNEQKKEVVSKSELKDFIKMTGKKHGVDPALSLSVAKAESDFDSKAVSKDGHESKGLFQLLDTTASTIMERDNINFKFNPFNPEQNTELGVSYLRYLHDLFSSKNQIRGNLESYPAGDPASLEKLAVAAFNAGEGRVASAQKRALEKGRNPAEYSEVVPFLPTSTRSYVEKVISGKEIFSIN